MSDTEEKLVEIPKPDAARRWDKTYPGGQWLYFPPDHDGEKMYSERTLAAMICALEAAQAFIEEAERMGWGKTSETALPATFDTLKMAVEGMNK